MHDLQRTPNPATKPPIPFRARLRRRTAIVSRWLHIYLSMVSFAIVLFFAATGLTLNHPEWFASQQRTVVKKGTADTKLLGVNPDKLALVELLRAREHVHGAVSEVRVDDSQVSVSLRAPGYTADAFIDRTTGNYELTEVSSGFIAVMNDLPKGRDSGKAWAIVIDVSAILLVLVSLTGFALMFFLYKKRTSGFLVAAAGTILAILLYRHFVP